MLGLRHVGNRDKKERKETTLPETEGSCDTQGAKVTTSLPQFGAGPFPLPPSRLSFLFSFFELL